MACGFGTCVSCGAENKNLQGRSLCWQCYKNPEVRERFPAEKRVSARGSPCRHCRTGKVNRPKGLCWPCYYTPGVREMYESTSKFARRGVIDFNGLTPDAWKPTSELPGSEGKVRVLIERARSGQSLWHPLDATNDPAFLS